MFFPFNYIIDKPDSTVMTADNNKPLVNTAVTFNCTSDAFPKAKYRFFRINSTGENEVSSLNSETPGIMVVPNILHIASTYNVTYKCVPYNFLGNGIEKTVMLDIQGSYIDRFSNNHFLLQIPLLDYMNFPLSLFRFNILLKMYYT